MGDVVSALADVCAAVRPGGRADAVGGKTPAVVASPATIAEASSLMRVASSHRLAVVPRGSGTKLGHGAPPVRCELIVDMSRFGHVIEHAAGDLVVRVQAGLLMADLAARLAPAGQQLALDLNGTVGGVIATGAAGPRRLRYGAPRDLLIGITVVLADGTVASAGGKVVKNVAGYDLGKLFAGSHGTLGLIAEAAFRLHPLPQASAYLTLSCATAQNAADRVRAAVESQLRPSAAEIDQPAPRAPLSVGVLLEGAAEALPERVTRMRDILGPGSQASATPPAWWGASVTGTDGVSLRVAFPPGALANVLDAVGASGAGLEPAVRGSAGSGVVEVGLAPGISPEAAGRFVTAVRRRLSPPPAWGEVPGASVTVLSAPAPVYEAVPAFGPVPALELMRAVKDRFDPGHLMSPGRFAGGI